MSKVRVSCPGKLMLFGEHSVVHDRHCIVTAVDQRLMVTIEKKESTNIVLTAPEVGLDHFTFSLEEATSPNLPKVARFVAQSVSNFYQKLQVSAGLEITTQSAFEATFGFGSSSAVTVATIKALDVLFATQLSDLDLFQLAYKTVLDIQGVGSGFDLASAIWGGTLLFANGGKEITPLHVDALPLVVGYTSVKADTATIVKQVGQLQSQYPPMVNSIFDQMESIVLQTQSFIEAKKWAEVGQYMNFQQGFLESLGVGSKELANLIFAARSAGAYGAKLSGAGGGDCMIAVVSPEKKSAVQEAITQAGGTVLPVLLSAPGLKVE